MSGYIPVALYHRFTATEQPVCKSVVYYYLCTFIRFPGQHQDCESGS